MISVIVPIYNAAEYLHECLDSILEQTEPDYEVILVDDGSTDSSLSICNDYAAYDPRFRVIHKENGGVSAARNAALDAARGQWYAFVDADDTIHPEMLASLLRMAIDTHSDLTMCNWHCGPTSKLATELEHDITIYTPREAALLSLYQKDVNCSFSGKLFASYLFAKSRFTEGMRYEDLEAFHRICLQAAQVAKIEDKLYYYRTNEESFINNFATARLDALRAVDMIESRYDRDPEMAKAARDRKFAANYNMFLLLSRQGKEHAETADRCWQTVKNLRSEVWHNPEARAKNRIGALLSYLGGWLPRLLSSPK